MNARSLLLAILFLCGACAAGPATFGRSPTEPVTWPPGSSQPRVSVLFTYRDSGDVERRRGFWSGLGNLLIGEDYERLGSPYGVAWLPGGEEGTLVIADTSLRALHYLSLDSGEHSIVWASDEGPFGVPVGVAVSPRGEVFVSDSAAGRIHVFDRTGKPLRSLGSRESLGRPTGLAWDELGQRLLVTDTTGGRVLALDGEGVILDRVGKTGDALGEFNHPTNLAVAKDGRVFVTDTLNFRVQVLNPDLQPMSSFGIAGSGPGAFSKPKGIAIDSEGHVYVVDALFDNVQVFDQEGRLLLTVCRSGNGFGNLSLPSGICIDPRDRIFVSDTGNSRIQAFQYRGVTP